MPRQKPRAIEALIALYQLSKDELDNRIHDALRNMERSDIGTIHSFAANLLRLYPLEAGVDPQFREDDGAHSTAFSTNNGNCGWIRNFPWTARTRRTGRKFSARCGLDQIKALAKSIAAENVDVRQNANQANAVFPALRDWLARLEAKAAALIELHPEDRQNEKLVRAARTVMSEFRKHGQRSDTLMRRIRAFVRKVDQSRSPGLAFRRCRKAQELVRIAKGLAKSMPS